MTRKADLAVRALIAVAAAATDDRDRLKGRDLAERLETTAGFLPQVMTPLVQAGWVRSDPGPTGGYTLAVDLGAISVLDVVEAVEGPTDTGKCVVAEKACDADRPCALHVAWSTARSRLLEALGGTRLTDLSPAVG
ncbi:MAG: Rrf2 family transcriptional regulator [Actinomycetota bacterium]